MTADALAPCIGFNLAERPHLWESLRLILPNPALRYVGTRLVDYGDDECLGVTLVPRRNVLLSGLRVRLWEERDELLLPLADFRPSQVRTLVRLAGVREATAMSVDSDVAGRILMTDAYPFLSAIGLTMNLTGSRRRVTAERPGKLPAEYEVPVNSGHGNQSLIGKPKRSTTTDRLRAIRLGDQERHLAQSDQEMWFSRDVDAAQMKLRELVGRAQHRVWVVDYFFAAPDAAVLLPAIGSTSVEIRVLTSREGLAANKAPGAAVRRLKMTISQLTDKLRMQPIAIRAMTGEAEIHDRFLVVDDRAYLLGSSINNYGQRGTMLVQLRGRSAVVEAIEAAWSRAKPLDQLPSADARRRGGSRTTVQRARSPLARSVRGACPFMRRSSA